MNSADSHYLRVIYRFLACALFLSVAGASVTCGASDDWMEILQRVRENVAAQLGQSSNYTCVQTIDRSYLRSPEDLPEGCANKGKSLARKEVMHDRLRLDVAVSEGAEIYSWHGENKFSTSKISDVVQTGPISSGGFVGFLHNVFLVPGVRFTYTGQASTNGVTTYCFSYIVPLKVSGYHVEARDRKPIVPFHGSFSVNPSNLQLNDLELIADELPDDSNVCSADTEMKYQITKISGKDSLIPALFLLRIDDNGHNYTVSRNEYSQCREFRGESTVSFNVSDTASAPVSTQPAAEEWLPAGMTLRVALRTPIDDRAAYTGDPIDGVLLDSVKIPATEKIIPKNAVLHGIISKLEFYSFPQQHYLVSIQFERLTSGNDTFTLRALPKQSRKEITKLSEMYGWPLPKNLADDFRKGLFVEVSSHFHLDSHFSAEWETRAPHADPARPGS